MIQHVLKHICIYTHIILCVCVCIYIYIYTHYIYIYIYIYPGQSPASLRASDFRCEELASGVWSVDDLRKNPAASLRVSITMIISMITIVIIVIIISSSSMKTWRLAPSAEGLRM